MPNRSLCLRWAATAAPKADGQAGVLAAFGIDEANMGCPVRSGMETVQLGTTKDGVPIYFDKIASTADHVLVINRVKQHTRLRGDLESGLCKMLMIGLGKHKGALTYHQVFARYDHRLDAIAKDIVPVITSNMPILAGLAVVEDAYDKVSLVKVVRPNDLLTEEPKLLEIAKQRMPQLPFARADLLIVDQIGKEISGTGMDTNVLGRKYSDHEAAPDEFPKIVQIYVRGLTEKTKGNASGIGIAEYCHARILNQMDIPKTRINCVTSQHVSAGAIPVYFDSDKEVLQAALPQAIVPTPAEPSGFGFWTRFT